MSNEDDGSSFGLVAPFLTDDPVFAYGCEFGMLYERMKHEDEIEEAYHTENQDRILVMAGRVGWVVDEVTPLDWEDGWFMLKMHKAEK